MANNILTNEMELLSQLNALDELIEDLKLHTLVQILTSDNTKTVSDEDFENNRKAAQGIRNKIRAILDVLEDIKANSMDELSNLGKMRVDHAIDRSQFNIDKFDKIFPMIVRHITPGDHTLLLPAILEQATFRSRKLQCYNQTYTQYLLSSKMNPDFDMYKDEKVKALISQMKSQVTMLENILCGISEEQKKIVQPIFDLIDYSKNTVREHEKYRKEHENDQE